MTGESHLRDIEVDWVEETPTGKLSKRLPATGIVFVEWVADCIGYLREKGLSRIEAQAEAEENWVAHVREVAGASLRSTCSSWYIGANVPGKPRVFMPYIGGFPAYVEKCDAVADNAYEGFALA
jgi:cyclohexanone monooxygenase